MHHFNEYNNCGYEGTNNGLKSHAAPVLPGHNLATSAATTMFQDDVKVAELHLKGARAVSQQQCLYSTLPCMNDVQPRLVSLLQKEWDLRTNYDVVGGIDLDSGNFIWKVTFKEDLTNVGKGSCIVPVPSFQRLCVVRIDEHGCLRCSCCNFEWCGYCCQHLLGVLCHIDPSYGGPSYTDCSVFW